MGLDVTYKGQQIAQLTEDGNLTLETAGKYCEGDIELSYSGGGGGGYDPFPIPEGYSLPSGCQKLACCDSDGHQICDTGYAPSIDTKIEISSYLTPGTYNGYSYMTGIPNLYIAATNEVNNPKYWGFGNKTDFTRIYPDHPGIPTFSLDKTEARITLAPFSDIVASCGATSLSYPSGSTIGIFGRYSGRTADRLCPIRFFRERIWENGTLVRCIFPILKDNTEVCLYDVINGIYMPNLGTGVLVGVM